MHSGAIQLTKDLYGRYLKEKGYRLVASTLRYPFPRGWVISRLRGCSKYNRDAAARWAFQVDTRIVFDDVDYDPQFKPPTQPSGSYAGGVYEIPEAAGEPAMRRIVGDICELTERLVREQKAIRKAFIRRIEVTRQGREGEVPYIPRKLSTGEAAQVEEWLAKQSRRTG